MDYVTRQFIKLAKKLRDDARKELSLLRIQLHHIKDAIRSIDENASAYHQKEKPKPEVIAILHNPEAVQAEHRAQYNQTQRRDRIRLFMEGLTFFSVVFYGYMAVRQWREQISARHQTQAAILAAERSAGAAEGTSHTSPSFAMNSRKSTWDSTLRTFAMLVASFPIAPTTIALTMNVEQRNSLVTAIVHVSQRYKCP